MQANPLLDEQLLFNVLNKAQELHKGQLRSSGEDYIIHPMAVGKILADLGMDNSTVAAGILHDVLEDTNMSHDQMQTLFGSEVTTLVEAVTKIKGLAYNTGRSYTKAETYRKFLLAVTKDVRVVFVKIADRLHNMRTLNHLPEEKRLRIAQETMEIYVPLAGKFGLQDIKRELEDFCLKYIYPDTYKELYSVVKEKKSVREAYIREFIAQVKELLAEENISATITGRSKHFWSIFRKKIKKNITYNDINDYYAIRIITADVEDCFRILGILNKHYHSLENTYKDYISQPKDNNYQSLHLVLISAEGSKVEVQIRTAEMHQIAESGSAAHWKYNEFIQLSQSHEVSHIKLDKAFEKQINLLRELLAKAKKDDPEQFVDVLKEELFKDKIIVKTPGGDYIELPMGATPLDFAFAIHSDIGLQCQSALVNGKNVSLRSKLENGDVVKIRTARNVKPGKNWLDFLVSPRARQQVRSWFRKKELQDAISLGKGIFDKEIKNYNLNLIDQQLKELAAKLKFSGIRDFYAAIGLGNLLMDKVLEVLMPDKAPDDYRLPGYDSEYSLEDDQPLISIDGLDNMMMRFAKCCNPLPGDNIIGYITRGRGLSIHRADCKNPAFIDLCKREPQRIMHLLWHKNDETQNVARIKLFSSPRPKLNHDITSLLAKLNIETMSSSSEVSGDHEEIELVVKIKNRKQLNKLKKELKNIKSVHEVH